MSGFQDNIPGIPENAPKAKRKPPSNEIVPQKKHEQLQRVADLTFGNTNQIMSSQLDQSDKINGLILDSDIHTTKLSAVELELAQIKVAAAGRNTWAAIRDVIQILLILTILVIIGYNTTQLWNWG